jgi:hypothetical protein
MSSNGKIPEAAAVTHLNQISWKYNRIYAEISDSFSSTHRKTYYYGF